jgi:ribosomal protein L15
MTTSGRVVAELDLKTPLPVTKTAKEAIQQAGGSVK